jgi:hypothetical protein
VIQTQIGGHGLEPAAGGRAVLQFREPLERAEEDFLGDVFRLGLIGGQAHGGAEYHVLVILQERLEVSRVRHGQGLLIRGRA